MEGSSPPGTEFKTIVIKMLKELSENFNQERATIKKKVIETIIINQSEVVYNN